MATDYIVNRLGGIEQMLRMTLNVCFILKKNPLKSQILSDDFYESSAFNL